MMKTAVDVRLGMMGNILKEIWFRKRLNRV